MIDEEFDWMLPSGFGNDVSKLVELWITTCDEVESQTKMGNGTAPDDFT